MSDRLVSRYPFEATIVVVEDRYNGVYSGAKFTAWLGMAPDQIDGDDACCSWFWDVNKRPCGKGKTSMEARDNLKAILQGQAL